MTEFLKRLGFGAKAWNAWRREHRETVIVLDHADLNGMILTGIDFTKVSLRGASMHATNVDVADLDEM